MTHETLQNGSRDIVTQNIFSKSLKHGSFVFMVNEFVQQEHSININKHTKVIRLVFLNKCFHSFKSSQLKSRKLYLQKNREDEGFVQFSTPSYFLKIWLKDQCEIQAQTLNLSGDSAWV